MSFAHLPGAIRLFRKDLLSQKRGALFFSGLEQLPAPLTVLVIALR
jgi:hypothetical protein